jgi:signal transduction histidine kinase
VFENLISNALKHNPPGVVVTLQATVEAEMIRCTVEDNGIGISQLQRDRLFQLYVRGSQSRHTPGLGIGLYLCQQIITAHGGEIDVISSPGLGTKFWFTLPLVGCMD